MPLCIQTIWNCFKTNLKFVTSPVNWLCLNFLWTNEKSYRSHLSPKGELNVNATKHLKSIKHAMREVQFTHYTFIEMWYLNLNTLSGSLSAILCRSNMQSYPTDKNVHLLGGCSILTPRKKLSAQIEKQTLQLLHRHLNQVPPPRITEASRAACCWWKGTHCGAVPLGTVRWRWLLSSAPCCLQAMPTSSMLRLKRWHLALPIGLHSMCFKRFPFLPCCALHLWSLLLLIEQSPIGVV